MIFHIAKVCFFFSGLLIFKHLLILYNSMNEYLPQLRQFPLKIYIFDILQQQHSKHKHPKNMLRDEVKKYIEYELKHGSQRELYHYNCAQSILHGSNDYYDLQLDPKALKMIVPFGGGMYTENTCGMLTGGIAVIGILFAEEMPTQNLKMKEITRYWTEEFE